MKKKLQTSFGEIITPKDHCLTVSGGTFKISAYLQELYCHVGQQEVFEEAAETIEKLLKIETNAKQIERVCHYYGEQLEVDFPLHQGNDTTACRVAEVSEPSYVMMDGTMLLTREEKWKEAKVGRIFKAKSNVPINKGRKYITDSQYVAHLGGHEAFLEKLSSYTDSLRQKIFIGDGAVWIWNWVEAYYPECEQILDFYHAKEHLCDYAKDRFHDHEMMTSWIEAQTALLLDDRVEEVIEHIRSIPLHAKKEEAESRRRLIGYYTTNLKRMRYRAFQEKGYAIGSGAIESAHRTIIQQRLKLSGQRWTKQGAQQILNLRTAKKSGQWNIVVSLTKRAA